MWNTFMQFVASHLTIIITTVISAAVTITVAAISTCPKLIPSTAQDWWDWARSTVQTAVPAARHQNETATVVTSTVAQTSTTSEAPITPAEPAKD